MRFALAAILAGAALSGCATTPPSPGPAIADADTRAWWALTGALSSDAMEGRDTGAPGYDRAAALVAERFRGAGLRPAGDRGTYLQPISFREVRVDGGGTSLTLSSTAQGGAVPAAEPEPMRFLHDWSVRPTEALPATVGGQLAFRGTCAEPLGDVGGKVVVCISTRRPGAPGSGQQIRAAADAGAAALVQVDNPHFTVEPPRWPVAYARAIGFPDAPPPPGANFPVIRWNAEAFGALIERYDPAALLLAADRGEPLPSFDSPIRLDARFAVTRGPLSAPNVLAILPGTDPALADEYIVVGADLDGYGYGEPVDGDRLYNGAFDNAAYVATLVRLAEQRQGRGFRRPILFAAFTGEEKGLLGSRWLVGHLPVPREQIVAMINLDQLRPIFPLELMTVHALEDSTVGQDARRVAEGMGIAVRLDPEPERNLIQRSDHWPFLQAGVPAVNFVFGYLPGTDSERRYRLWYSTRYHHPGDDMTQPWDPVAAARFNAFFYRLVETVADADRRPAFLGQNPYAAR